MSRSSYKFRAKNCDMDRLLFEGVEDDSLVVMLIGTEEPVLFIQKKILEAVGADYACLGERIGPEWGFGGCHKKYRFCRFSRKNINKVITEVDKLILFYQGCLRPKKHYTVITWKDDNGERTGPFGCGGEGASAS